MGIRVLIVDDHALVRAGMHMILSAQADIEVVGEAESGEAALPLIRRLKPDVVLCDLHLQGLSGLEVTERIAQGGHGPRVIIVSVLEDGPMPRRLIEAGASGYVGKGGDAQELLTAVREVARGKRYLASSVARSMALSGLDGSAKPVDALTARELEVGLLLAQGIRQHDIAQRLSLSAKTINTHKSRLFSKLGIGDTVALVRLLRQHGMLDPATA
ncbi:response regulator [Lysobacter solisilvae (ex Woo and Kim 2020)]|uniref:Response regulator transcription factor n=1 Tax=Agrilutibacter terrestris TaxID=2865112 RepID=A0A7H0FX59_9GAMM|nr:response regulator transcription factor [Lysobacter terrestris]QNP40625.1 response regulator transcription factor [Lysobacter terrestris]